MKRLCILIALALGGIPQAQAQGFATIAPQAILVDVESGSVLFDKAGDEPVAPASMAKLMTAEILFNEIKRGRLTLESEFTISENAWRRGGASSGGSSMFAQLNSRIKLSDLIRGLIVQSGNDAAIAIAEGVAGTEENFAGLMNRRAKELGLTRSTFRNAAGLPHPEQKVAMRDLAKLAQHIIETYPDLYPIYAEREFTWSKIRQQNRNPLLTMDIGADGLKTGNTDESGYGLVGSAVQNGQRLILAMNGLKTARDRALEARKIIEWGFRAFEPRQLFAADEVIGEAQVFGGDKGSVELVAGKPVRLLVPRGAPERLSARIVYTGPLIPPVKAGATVAKLRVSRGDSEAVEVPLVARTDVEVGPLHRRALDALLEWSSGLVRRGIGSLKPS